MKPRKTPSVKEAPEKLVALSKMNPAAYNPRIDLGPEDRGYIDLERVIDEFGLVQPIVWNKQTGNIVGGHQKYKILKRKGVKATGAKIVDLPLERERILNVALNNDRIGGGWDNAKMDALLKIIEKVPEDLTLAGFTEEERALFEAPIDLPPDFRTIGADLKTDHECPSCSYQWSGDCKSAKKPEPKK